MFDWFNGGVKNSNVMKKGRFKMVEQTFLMWLPHAREACEIDVICACECGGYMPFTTILFCNVGLSLLLVVAQQMLSSWKNYTLGRCWV